MPRPLWLSCSQADPRRKAGHGTTCRRKLVLKPKLNCFAAHTNLCLQAAFLLPYAPIPRSEASSSHMTVATSLRLTTARG